MKYNHSGLIRVKYSRDNKHSSFDKAYNSLGLLMDNFDKCIKSFTSNK